MHSSDRTRSDQAMDLILCGDVGGTNTRLLLYKLNRAAPGVLVVGKKAPGELQCSAKYMNEKYNAFDDILSDFITKNGINSTILSACFAVAGPVKDNKVKITNRSTWTMDGELLQSKFNIKNVSIVNDFLAVGYGLLTVDKTTDCVTLQTGNPNTEGSPIACIGAGTGLGQCYLTAAKHGDSFEYTCYPSEGGHAEFSPRNDIEIELLKYLKDKFAQPNRVSVERVVSGLGLVNIYEFLSKKYPSDINKKIQEEYDGAGDMQAAVIASNYKNNVLCQKAMDIFTTAYGAEAGVAALKWLPFGGLYLTGGLTPKNIELIKSPKFLEALLDKGRLSNALLAIPIYAILVEDVGERGSHYIAFYNYIKENKKKSSQQFITPGMIVAFCLGIGIAFKIFKKK